MELSGELHYRDFGNHWLGRRTGLAAVAKGRKNFRQWPCRESDPGSLVTIPRL